MIEANSNLSVKSVQPILVVPVYRGGQRFLRCLGSLVHAKDFFSGLLLSINGSPDSPDLIAARQFQATVDFPITILNTGVELSSMDHIRYWGSFLRDIKTPVDQHVMWLGHDDELNPVGLAKSCRNGFWTLSEDTMILGPWKLRHESTDSLYQVPVNEVLETWTCFPDSPPIYMKSMDWACDQLVHPTYINLTGGVFPLRSLLEVIDFKPRKVAAMRMEMTLATAVGSKFITELPEAITIVYGRADSDRAMISRKDALSDDRNLFLWLGKFAAMTPGSRKRFAKTMLLLVILKVKIVFGRAQPPTEDWVVRL